MISYYIYLHFNIHNKPTILLEGRGTDWVGGFFRAIHYQGAQIWRKNPYPWFIAQVRWSEGRSKIQQFVRIHGMTFGVATRLAMSLNQMGLLVALCREWIYIMETLGPDCFQSVHPKWCHFGTCCNFTDTVRTLFPFLTENTFVSVSPRFLSWNRRKRATGLLEGLSMVLQNATPEVVWQTRISRIGANGRRWHRVHPSLHVPRQETCFDWLSMISCNNMQQLNLNLPSNPPKAVKDHEKKH